MGHPGVHKPYLLWAVASLVQTILRHVWSCRREGAYCLWLVMQTGCRVRLGLRCTVGSVVELLAHWSSCRAAVKHGVSALDGRRMVVVLVLDLFRRIVEKVSCGG